MLQRVESWLAPDIAGTKSRSGAALAEGSRAIAAPLAATRVDVRDLLCLGPGRLAEEFRRRAGLSSRDLKSCARVFLDWLLLDPPF